MLEHYIRYRKCWNGFTRQLLTNCNNLHKFLCSLVKEFNIYILYSFLNKNIILEIIVWGNDNVSKHNV